MIPVGHQIYLRRLDQNLTQKEFAARVQIPQPNLSNIEKGKQDITVSTLRRIAAALNVQPGEFFGELNDEAGRKVLSRSKIEKIAKLIAEGAAPFESEDSVIVELFKNVLPHKGKPRLKELHRSWLELRKRFNPQEINSIYERVEEYKRRK